MLTALYVGFNGKDLSQEKLSEINETLSTFTASSLATKSKNPSLNKLRKKLTELNLHSEFMSILARKYNLVDKNLTGDLITDNTNIKKHPVGKIIPETIGSDKNLFENNQTQYISNEDSVNCFHTNYPKNNAPVTLSLIHI